MLHGPSPKHHRGDTTCLPKTNPPACRLQEGFPPFASSQSVHSAIETLAFYSPIFVIGSITAYLISQTFDVWLFNKIKDITKGKYLWLRNNLSTLSSQALDTFIYTFVWVIAGELSFFVALSIALTKYIFKVIIAIIDTLFIYVVRSWTPTYEKNY